MRTLRLFAGILFLFCFVAAIHAQKENTVTYPSYEECGVIPEWVKEVTTPEEYKIWETLSQYYKIDYSELKKRNWTDEERKEEYARLRAMCESLKQYDTKKWSGSRFVFPYGVLATSEAYSTTPLRCMESRYIIYSSLDGYDAHVVLDVVYTINPQTKQPRIIHHEIKAVSFSGLEVRVEEHIPGNDELSQFGAKIEAIGDGFRGYYPGTLYFTDPTNGKHSEPLNINFHCVMKQ